MNPESRGCWREIPRCAIAHLKFALTRARNDKEKLLPVFGQNLVAGPAYSGAVLLQARQHDLVTVVHHRTAMAANIPRAGVVPLLLRRRGSHRNKRDDQKKSGHDVAPHTRQGCADQILLPR
jgi:hypothetical protein